MVGEVKIGLMHTVRKSHGRQVVGGEVSEERHNQPLQRIYEKAQGMNRTAHLSNMRGKICKIVGAMGKKGMRDLLMRVRERSGEIRV